MILYSRFQRMDMGMKRERQILGAEGCVWCQCHACLMLPTAVEEFGHHLISVDPLDLVIIRSKITN